MNNLSILLPLLAMVMLTFAVWVKLYIDRVSEMRSRKISPQDIATSRLMAERLKNTNAADNFRNLFEVPVLFYIFCLVAFSTNLTSIALVIGAWLFVLFRMAHSVIHCTYNNVMHRFVAYVISALILLASWIALGIQIAIATLH